MIGIYAIHNTVNNKYYIGQSVNITNRWRQHRNSLNSNQHENSHLQAAWNKYGESAFRYIVLCECDLGSLDSAEAEYIQKYQSYTNGYNQDLGGAGCRGYKHTDEEIQKMRQIQKPKAVLQIDKELNVVAEFASCSHAGKTTGFSIRGIKAVCNRVNHQKTIGGYYWVYKEEFDSSTVDWGYYLNKNNQEKKKISQYNLKMELVKIWDSMSQIENELGFSMSQIVRNCKFNSRTAYNCIWRYTDEYTTEQYERDLHSNYCPTPDKTKKKIAQYDLNMNQIAIFDSVSAVTKQYGFHRAAISACCRGEQKSSHGFIWKYI